MINIYGETSNMKKNTNVSGRGKRKFTILDFIICLALIAGATYIGIRFFVFNESEENSLVKYKISFMISEEHKDVFSVGDEVLTPNGEKVIGKISKIEFKQATEKRFKYTTLHDEDFNDFEKTESGDDSILLLANATNTLTGEDMESSDILQEDISLDASDTSDESVEDVFNDESIVDESSDESDFVYEENIEGYVIVTVTVEADLEYSQGSYYIDNNVIKIDSEIELTTKKYSIVGRCEAIENGNAEQRG
jgi:hypothetical protein